METTIIKFITFFFVFFAFAKACIQIKEFQIIKRNMDLSNNISLYDLGIYSMMNLTTAGYTFFILKSMLLSVFFSVFFLISLAVAVVVFRYRMKPNIAEGQTKIQDDTGLQVIGFTDPEEDKHIEDNNDNNFIKTNLDYLEGVDFSQKGDAKIDEFDWKNFKEKNLTDNKVDAPKESIPENNVLSSTPENVVKTLNNDNVDQSVVEKVEVKQDVLVDTPANEEVSQKSELNQMLEKFNPELHGGEVMADRPVGQEILPAIEDVQAVEVEKVDSSTDVKQEIVNNIDETVKADDKVIEKSDIIQKKKNSRKRKPKNEK